MIQYWRYDNGVRLLKRYVEKGVRSVVAWVEPLIMFVHCIFQALLKLAEKYGNAAVAKSLLAKAKLSDGASKLIPPRLLTMQISHSQTQVICIYVNYCMMAFLLGCICRKAFLCFFCGYLQEGRFGE